MNPKVRERLSALSRAAARHRYWVVLLATTAAALAIAGAVRVDSIRRATQLQTLRAEQLRQIETARSWWSDFQPPTPAESLAWQKALAEVKTLSEPDPDRLRAAQLVAERAQAAGIRTVRLNFALSDTLETAVPLPQSGTQLASANWVLVVELSGDLQSLARFLENLPPGIALWRLQVIREGTEGRATLRLLRYRIVGAAATAGESPVQ